jgi:hypothetical protein
MSITFLALLLLFSLTIVLFLYRPKSDSLSAKNIFQGILNSFLAYPLVICFSLLATAATTFHIWWINDWYQEIFRLELALVFGISLSYAFYSLGKIRREIISLLVPLIVFFAYYIQRDQATITFSIRWVQFFILSHLFVSFAPHTKTNSQETFWKYNKNILFCFVVAAIYSAFIFISISIAIGAIQYLFEIKDPDWFKTYPTLWAICALLIHPLIFLGVSESKLKENTDENLKALRIFAAYVLIPVVLLYLLILLSYGLKIAVSAELPKGMVGWLVCSFGLAGTFTWLLTYPLGKERSGLIKFFHLRFFNLFIPLLILLGIAVYERVSNYGFTELRYLLFILTIWISIITILFTVRPNAQIKLIPISLLLLTALTIYGPLSAFSVSLKSQTGRLDKFLFSKTNCSELSVGEIPLTDTKEITSILSYLITNHTQQTFTLLKSICHKNPKALAVIENFSSKTEQKDGFSNNEHYRLKYTFAQEFLPTLGLQAISEHEKIPSANEKVFYFSTNSQHDLRIYDVSNFDSFISNLSIYKNHERDATLADGSKINFAISDSSLITKIGDSSIIINFTELIHKISQDTQKQYTWSAVPPEIFMLEKEMNGIKIKLFLRHISGRREENDIAIKSMSADVGVSIRNFPSKAANIH